MSTDQSSDEQITRLAFISVIEEALPRLERGEDRAAVLDFARTATQFVAGTWTAPGRATCRCPASAVGLDRMRPDVRGFAGAFDAALDVDPEFEWVVFHVAEAAA